MVEMEPPLWRRSMKSIRQFEIAIHNFLAAKAREVISSDEPDEWSDSIGINELKLYGA